MLSSCKVYRSISSLLKIEWCKKLLIMIISNRDKIVNYLNDGRNYIESKI